MWFYERSGSGSVDISASNGPTVAGPHAKGVWVTDEIMIVRGNTCDWRKFALVPLWRPQIPQHYHETEPGTSRWESGDYSLSLRNNLFNYVRLFVFHWCQFVFTFTLIVMMAILNEWILALQSTVITVYTICYVYLCYVSFSKQTTIVCVHRALISRPL
jgi:hypothetical protein